MKPCKSTASAHTRQLVPMKWNGYVLRFLVCCWDRVGVVFGPFSDRHIFSRLTNFVISAFSRKRIADIAFFLSRKRIADIAFAASFLSILASKLFGKRFLGLCQTILHWKRNENKTKYISFGLPHSQNVKISPGTTLQSSFKHLLQQKQQARRLQRQRTNCVIPLQLPGMRVPT